MIAGKKIALVYDAVFPFVKGGAEKRFFEIGKRLAKDGYDVHLYGMKYWEGPAAVPFEGMTLHGLCKNYPLYTKSGRRSMFQAFWFGMSCLKLLREEFDVIDCCGFPYFSLFSCRIVTFVKRKPLFATWHEVWGKDYWKQYLGALGTIGYFIERITVKLPDTIISVSTDTTNALHEVLRRNRNVVTITNGVDIADMQKIAPSHRSADILFAGRLISHKNVDVLLRAVKMLKQKKQNISLFIVGDGPEKENLKKLTRELNLEDNVSFLGFMEKSEDVYGIMRSAKLFVSPSTREGFGIVAIEANACGLPVITINHEHNAARNIIANGENGIVCDLNEQAIALAAEHLLQTRKEAEFYSAYAAKYDWGSIFEEIKNAYHI